MSLAEFTRGYIDSLLWSSNGPDDEPLDRYHDASDLAPAADKIIVRDCSQFYAKYESVWCDQCLHGPHLDITEDEYAGHDFWLTRNGHGAGFWDGDWLDPAATVLTEVCKALGECQPYVGDDGKIYLFEG